MTPIEWILAVTAVIAVIALFFGAVGVFGPPDKEWVKQEIRSNIQYHDERPYAHLPMRQAIEQNYKLSASGPDTNPGWSMRDLDREDRANFDKLFRENTVRRLDNLTDLFVTHDMRLDAIEFAIDPDEFPIRAEDI